ncbi:MAG: hypothetical protein B6U89_07660, partial [Desulfurococcales archaeon ex4484_58]
MNNFFKVLEIFLTLKIDPDHGSLGGIATYTIMNHSRFNDKIRFIINKGLRVDDVESSHFIKEVKQYGDTLSDLEKVYVNVLDIIFDKQLNINEKLKLSIRFSGVIKDYSHVFSYVKDRVGEYTLIRTDAYSYPIPIFGKLSFNNLVSSILNQRFNYRLEVNVPRGYVVANVGKQVLHRVSSNRELYVFVSKIPSWRIDVAITKFKYLYREDLDLKIYYLPDDEEYACKILNALTNCYNYYKSLFGEPIKWNGYTIIELPESWGSQADYTGMLLERKSFIDPKHIGVYHELAHLWNVASGEEYPSRFLDEGFASYFQLLAEKKFIGEQWFVERINSVHEKIKSLIKNIPKLSEIPLVDYGKY